jgi:hypothetical protein
VSAIISGLLPLSTVASTIFFWRFLYRVVRWLTGLETPREHPLERAARLVGFVVPPGYEPRPKVWQRQRQSQRDTSLRPNPYAPRPVEAD